jgi:hypothetical protein
MLPPKTVISRRKDTRRLVLMPSASSANAAYGYLQLTVSFDHSSPQTQTQKKNMKKVTLHFPLELKRAPLILSRQTKSKHRVVISHVFLSLLHRMPAINKLLFFARVYLLFSIIKGLIRSAITQQRPRRRAVYICTMNTDRASGIPIHPIRLNSDNFGALAYEYLAWNDNASAQYKEMCYIYALDYFKNLLIMPAIGFIF